MAPRGLPRWVAVTAWTGIIVALVTGAARVVGQYRGDPASARRVALAEAEALLERDERILAQAPVHQRTWWDYYRHTWGVLAATDRRLLYVGVAPQPVLHRAVGPADVVDASFRYARGVSVTRGRARGAGTRLRLVSGAAREEVVAARGDDARLAAVLDTLAGRQAALAAAADAERRAIAAALAASRRATWHLVQRGEALDAIARRYGTTVDSLLAWNTLAGPRIVTGQRLLVRPGQEP